MKPADEALRGRSPGAWPAACTATLLGSWVTLAPAVLIDVGILGPAASIDVGSRQMSRDTTLETQPPSFGDLIRT
jgi:hypothetical protein